MLMWHYEDELTVLDISIKLVVLFLMLGLCYLFRSFMLLYSTRLSRLMHGGVMIVFGRMGYEVECIYSRIRYLYRIILLVIGHTFHVWRLSAKLILRCWPIICKLNGLGIITKLLDMGRYGLLLLKRGLLIVAMLNHSLSDPHF